MVHFIGDSILMLQLFESPIKCTVFSTEHSGESGPTIHDSPLGMDHLHSVKLKVYAQMFSICTVKLRVLMRVTN
jgi:hypothetical protein